MKQLYISMCVLLGVVVGSAWAEKVVERYDDGKTKAEYITDAEGRKHGPFREFHPTGRTARQGRYIEGKLHGPVVEFDEAGRKSGEQVWAEGVLLIPRGRTEVAGALRDIARTRVTGGDSASQDALRRLMMYRYLCGAPHEGMELDPEMTKLAEAAALVCERLDTLTHHPDRNPGLPDDVYERGRVGCAKSNLSWGTWTARNSGVDGYMDDSDERNIDRVGHRRWCLNPSMLKTGFGRSGKYGAMYAHDRSRTDVPDWNMITYPARGYMPSEFFGAEHAWSVTLNPKHYAEPSKSSVKVSVWPVRSPALDIDRLTVGEPLKLNYFNVETSGFGVSNCIIFRPEGAPPAARRGYFVQIEGVKTASGEPAVIRYYVEFM